MITVHITDPNLCIDRRYHVPDGSEIQIRYIPQDRGWSTGYMNVRGDWQELDFLEYPV